MAETKRNLTLALEGEDRPTIEQIIEDEIGVVVSGTYVPIFTPVTNADSVSTDVAWVYQRIGAAVMVGGSINIDATDSGDIVVRASLPISSNFTNGAHLNGAGYSQATGVNIEARADITNDEAEFILNTSDLVGRRYRFAFAYTII